MAMGSAGDNWQQRPRGSWFDALAFTAGLLGGLVSTIAGAASGSRRRRQALRPARGGVLARRVDGFPALRASLFGYTKREVARALGPPPAASLGPVADHGGFWQANTWYYPFDPLRQTAVAVQFDHDRVSRVDYIGQLS